MMEQSDLNLLQTVPSYHLQALAKLLRLTSVTKVLSSDSSVGHDESAPTTERVIAEIGSHLFNSSALTEKIASLGKVQMALLQELVACGGRANSRDLALYITRSGLLDSAKEQEVYSGGTPSSSSTLYPVPHPHGIFEQALHSLLYLGLVFWGKQTNFAGHDYTNGVYDGVLIVPQAVQRVVKKFGKQEEERAKLQEQEVQQEREGRQEQEAARNGEEVSEEIRSLQRSLYLYWSLVASLRDGLPLVQTGFLARSSLRQVLELFGMKLQLEPIRTEQDVPRLLFLRLLLMQLGLLEERESILYADASAETFFALPLRERARKCYHLWRETPFWNELVFLQDVILRPAIVSLEPAHEEVVRARKMVVERLLHETANTWHEMAVFIARTKLYTPYLLFPRQYGARLERYSQGRNPYNVDFRLRHGWLTHREGWHMVEGGFIRAMVVGPLHWLGLVEIKDEKTALAFCIPSHALFLTGEVPFSSDEEVQTGRLIVQPNFELVALAPISESLLVKLDRFAERIQFEHIAQYRLTKASVTRAIQKGLDANMIVKMLEEAAGGDIPQNVQYSLAEWERQIRRIEVWPAMTLLEVDDAALLDRLFANEKTRSLFGRRLAPTLAEVALHQLEAVQQLLSRQNYLPALAVAPTSDLLLEDGHRAQREPQWRLHEDGLLEPLYPLLNRFLAVDSSRLSEPDTVTGWQRITPASLQKAFETGIALEAILRFLQSYCLDGVPSSFLMRLKLWGDGYGDQATIQVEESPLLYLSEQVLRDCQADDELNALLGEEVPQEGRLVRVSQENLGRIRELLRERGFEVK